MSDTADVMPAEFVRWLDDSQSLDELVNDAKALTWETQREHAVVVLRPNRRAMIRGGRHGIEFIVKEPSLAAIVEIPVVMPSLWMDVNGVEFQVDRLEFHTHPRVTGPSDTDCRVIEMLGQDQSVIYEINGEREGTVFHPKSGS
jgi:hypothetical protein